MNLVYFFLVIVVLVAVLIDSMTLIFMVLATIMLLPGCGSQIPTTSCTINGEDCHAQQDSDIQGPQGNDGPTGPQGPSAPAGRDGAGGKTGNAGKDCTVVQGVGGATISCGDGTSAVITNGSSGIAGTNGTNGTGVVVIDPCGSQSSEDDTLLVIGGKVYGIVKESGDIFLTDLVPGRYTTRDDTDCHYTVHADATVTW